MKFCLWAAGFFFCNSILLNLSAQEGKSQWRMSDFGRDTRQISASLAVSPGGKEKFAFYLHKKQKFNFMLTRAKKSLLITLKLPDGSLITSESHPEYFLYSEDGTPDGTPMKIPFFELNQSFVCVEIPNAPAGKYQLLLDGKKLKKEEKYIFFGHEKAKLWTLEARLQKKNILKEESFVVEARINNAGKIVKDRKRYPVLCVMQDMYADKKKQRTIKLSDDGTGVDKMADDGVYTCSASVIKHSYYDFFIVAERKNDEKDAAKRVVRLLGSWSGNGASIANFSEEFIDKNHNGLCDLLRVHATVTVEKPGRFYVDAELVSQENVVIANDTYHFSCDKAGSNAVFFDFSGEKIFKSGQTGSRVVKNIEISEKQNGTLALTLQKSDREYQTEPKNYLEYEHDRIYFLGTGSDCLVDENKDGCADKLDVQLNVFVDRGYAGHYTWKVKMWDNKRTFFLEAENPCDLEESLNLDSPKQLNLSFPLPPMVKKQNSVSFKVRWVELGGERFQFSHPYSCSYETKKYTSRDFVKKVVKTNE